MNICTNHRTNFCLLTIVAVLLLSFVMSQDAYSQRRRHTRRPRTAMSQKKSQRDAIPSITTVINNIEGLYDSRTLTNLMDGSYTQIIDTISNYFAGLPKAFKRDDVIKHYYDAIVEASEQEGQDMALLRNGIIQIALGEPTEMETAYTAVAMYYANTNDKDNLSQILYYFNEYSRLHDNAFNSVIEQLYKEYDEVLHPVPFTEKVKGTWVMVNRINERGFPYSIITINNLMQQYGGISMINFPGRDNTTSDKKIASLKYSQIIGGHNGYIEATFGSDHITEGGSGFAQSGYEMTRKFRADMAGEIAASDGSVGEKVLHSVATEAIGCVLDGLFSLTVSSGYQRTAALNMQLYQTSSPDILQGAIQYWDYKRPGDQPNFRTPPPIYNGNAEYVRWEPKDGVYFVSKKGKVYSVTPTSQLDLTEYKKIKKKYSWTQPKYLLPFIGAEAVGAVMLISGIHQISGCNIKDEYGNYVYDSDGAKKINNAKFNRGVALGVIGYFTMLIPPIAIPSIISSKKAAAYTKLNRENLQKLKNKGAMRLSLAPMVDINETFGLSANIQF